MTNDRPSIYGTVYAFNYSLYFYVFALLVRQAVHFTICSSDKSIAWAII